MDEDDIRFKDIKVKPKKVSTNDLALYVTTKKKRNGQKSKEYSNENTSNYGHK
jgi:hypothetical protein